MSTMRSACRPALCLTAILIVITPLSGGTQTSRPPPAADSTALSASRRYEAGALHRLMLGNNYRDLWATPIKVPILDLATYAGGIRPTKTGGGAQTKTLHFETSEGVEYVFRPVYKALLMDLAGFEGTIVQDLMADGMSASFPVAPLIAPALLDAAGLPHPVPQLVVMSNDARLGEYRKEFAGMLGMIEDHPSVPDDAPGFWGAVKIIDSDELLKRIDEDPREQIDARALLRARLIDLLLNDNDRHPDQWKWARLSPGPSAPWVPIPRDRDKVLVSYEGVLLRLARLVKPDLVTFSATYPHLSGLFQNAIEFDRRLLGSLDKPVWDSVATSLTRAISDSVIDAAFRTIPPAYRTAVPTLVAKMRSRRDGLPFAADHYYRTLFAVVDIHATDADERATITRLADGGVDVRIQVGSAAPHFVRRYDPRLTSEIRLYLHEGKDTAVVTGSPVNSIAIRVIGGNGNNTLVDSSTIGGRPLTRFYDDGSVTAVQYRSDSSAKSHTAFNRRPLLPVYGERIPAQRDRGASTQPVFSLRTGRDLGLVPQLGLRRTRYGFRTIPYASQAELQVGYSTSLSAFEVVLETDNRFEESRFHVMSESRVSQLEVGRFVGFGNDMPYADGAFHDVRSTQWTFHPALGAALGPHSDVSLGPIVKYTTTDSLAGRMIASVQPYGFTPFGQAGLQLDLNFDTREGQPAIGGTRGASTTAKKPATSAFITAVSASAYPALWDATSAFTKVSAVAVVHLTLPAPTHPVLALRAGGEKVWGEHPYFEAAFLGGSHSLRTAVRQRFAGDASLHGSAELRVPVAKFAFVLPLNVGLLGFTEAGRVYTNGESPGGWHSGTGAGLWLGVLNPGTSVTVMVTNRRDRRVLFGLGFDY